MKTVLLSSYKARRKTHHSLPVSLLLQRSPNFVSKFILPVSIGRGTNEEMPMFDLISQSHSHVRSQPGVLLKFQGVNDNRSTLRIGWRDSVAVVDLAGLGINRECPAQGLQETQRKAPKVRRTPHDIKSNAKRRSLKPLHHLCHLAQPVIHLRKYRARLKRSIPVAKSRRHPRQNLDSLFHF